MALGTTDVSEEFTASVIRVMRISDLGAKLAVLSLLILFILNIEEISSSETSVLTRAPLRHFP
jgi:hypothetical protein